MHMSQWLALTYLVGLVAFLPSAYEGDRKFGHPTRSRAQAVLDAVLISGFWPLSSLVHLIAIVARHRPGTRFNVRPGSKAARGSASEGGSSGPGRKADLGNAC